MSDKIEKIPNDQLQSLLNAVRAHIRRTRKHGGDTRDGEVELCYLEREDEHRKKTIQLEKEYREKLDRARKAEAREAREEEEALKDYWESENN